MRYHKGDELARELDFIWSAPSDKQAVMLRAAQRAWGALAGKQGRAAHEEWNPANNLEVDPAPVRP